MNMDGDQIVQILAIVMAMALLSASGTLRATPWRRRLLYGAIWVAIFVVATLLLRLFMAQESSIV